MIAPVDVGPAIWLSGIWGTLRFAQSAPQGQGGALQPIVVRPYFKPITS